jgi:hypothetical protein
MQSQLEILRESLAKLEASGLGSSSPLVHGMRSQILSIERDQQRREMGGFFDDDGKIKPQYQNPCM